MIRILLGTIALLQIIIGALYISGSDIFAAISFDTQPASTWTREDTANAYYGPSSAPAIVSIGSIVINTESH